MAKKVLEKDSESESESDQPSVKAKDESDSSAFKPLKKKGAVQKSTPQKASAAKSPTAKSTPVKNSTPQKKQTQSKPVQPLPQIKKISKPNISKITKDKKKVSKTKEVQSDAASESEDVNDNENFKLYQKKETPPNDDPCRIFYETLYKQRPNSCIAIKFCLEFGLIDDINDIKKAQKVLEKKPTTKR